MSLVFRAKYSGDAIGYAGSASTFLFKFFPKFLPTIRLLSGSALPGSRPPSVAASSATANRKLATANPCRRGDRTRNARATLRLARKNAAPLARRRVDLNLVLVTYGYPPPNLTVTRLEQFPVPATHT